MLVNANGTEGVTLVRASDGQQITIPNGSAVTYHDDKGATQLKNQYARPCDVPVDYDGVLYFMHRDCLVWPVSNRAP